MSIIKVKIEGKVVLVTGANRGIGRAIVEELMSRGAARVYAGARDVGKLADLQSKYQDRIVPVQLDVTSESDIKKAAEVANDVDILINNAGLGIFGGFFGEGAADAFQQNLDVNVHGLINVTAAFIDTLKSRESAAIVNLSSIAGLANMPVLGGYSATKAAVHSITQGFRGELANENILISGVYPGPIDTDMAEKFEMDKDSPQNAASAILNGVESGEEDIYPDPMSTGAGQGYKVDPKAIEKQFAAFVG
ncbi:MAG: SDR family oxidoreductase [Reichenbachiella sp.]